MEMNTNRQTLDSFFETHQIDLRRGSIFDTPPNPKRREKQVEREFSMREGMPPSFMHTL
jgi:hypothetical protein